MVMATLEIRLQNNYGEDEDDIADDDVPYGDGVTMNMRVIDGVDGP